MSFYSIKCVYLGPSMSHEGFKCLSSTGRIYISRHVIFNEKGFPFKKGLLNTRKPEQMSSEVIHTLPILPNRVSEADPSNICSSNVQISQDAKIDTGSIDSKYGKTLEPANEKTSELHFEQPEAVIEEQTTTQPELVDNNTTSKSIHPMITRSKSGAIKPKSAYVGLTEGVIVPNPTDPNEALMVPHWKKAMEQDDKVLVKNDTWQLVLYKGQQLIDCKWIFRIKLAADGSIARHKARRGQGVSTRPRHKCW